MLRQQFAQADSTKIQNDVEFTETVSNITNTSEMRRRAVVKSVLKVTAYYVGQGFQSILYLHVKGIALSSNMRKP